MPTPIKSVQPRSPWGLDKRQLDAVAEGLLQKLADAGPDYTKLEIREFGYDNGQLFMRAQVKLPAFELAREQYQPHFDLHLSRVGDAMVLTQTVGSAMAGPSHYFTPDVTHKLNPAEAKALLAGVRGYYDREGASGILAGLQAAAATPNRVGSAGHR